MHLKAQNDQRPFERIYRVSNSTAQTKLLHYLSQSVNLHIPTGCCANFLSSLMTKNLVICVMTKAIAGDQFWKMQIPHTIFMFNAWGVFRPNLRAIHLTPLLCQLWTLWCWQPIEILGYKCETIVVVNISWKLVQCVAKALWEFAANLSSLSQSFISWCLHSRLVAWFFLSVLLH